MRYTVAVLDIDGTIVDSNDAHAKAWMQAFAQYGHAVDFHEVRGSESAWVATSCSGKSPASTARALKGAVSRPQGGLFSPPTFFRAFSQLPGHDT